MECPPSYIDKWVTSVSSRFTAITTRDQDVYATSYGPNNAVMLYTINRANTSPPTTSTVISPFLPANTYMYPVGVAVYNNYVYVVVSCHQILRCKLLESAWAVFSGSTTGLSGNTNSRAGCAWICYRGHCSLGARSSRCALRKRWLVHLFHRWNWREGVRSRLWYRRDAP